MKTQRDFWQSYEYQIIISIAAMNVRFNILFKIACGSMFAAVALGARYGHVGQLD